MESELEIGTFDNRVMDIFVIRYLEDSILTISIRLISGINCSSINLITPLLQSAQDVIKELNVPILIMPNLKKNLTTFEEGNRRESLRSAKSNVTAEEVFFDVIERKCLEWYQLGVRWFGACCGTKVKFADIRQLIHLIGLNVGGVFLKDSLTMYCHCSAETFVIAMFSFAKA